MGLTRYWFFARQGTVLVAAADCSSPDAAVRLARDYNREPGISGPVDLITDHKVPAEAYRRIVVGTEAVEVPPSNGDESEG